MILIRMMKPERISKDDTLQLKKAIINIQLDLKASKKSMAQAQKISIKSFSQGILETMKIILSGPGFMRCWGKIRKDW